jgi:Na+/H+-dicarboxylate symporter
MVNNKQGRLTAYILIAMALGIIIGLVIHALPHYTFLSDYITNGVLDFGGKVFLNVLKMVVVPIVFVSLVCGTFSLDNSLNFGRIATKTLLLYMLTTALAITLALFVSNLIHLGVGTETKGLSAPFQPEQVPSIKQTLLNIFPSNPIKAFAEGNMLQIIVFAILFGVSIAWAKERGQRLREFFRDLDAVVMNLVSIVLKLAPFGIFCLVSKLFAENGTPLFVHLTGYFLTVVFVLFLQLFLVYAFFIRYVAGLNPVQFFRNMFPAMLFGFSTSSSSASIPVVLDAVERRLGVKESIGSFVIPLGATINMDGTAIMQGVATVFIANCYNIHLSIFAFLKIILTATLASIGTAGIPSVGLITLMMVLLQVGLPVEGIALIIGIDRLLDMLRTAVNISGDAMISCVVAVKEKQINLRRYNSRSNDNEEDYSDD